MSDATVPWDLIDHDHPDHFGYPLLSRHRFCADCRSVSSPERHEIFCPPGAGMSGCDYEYHLCTCGKPWAECWTVRSASSSPDRPPVLRPRYNADGFQIIGEPSPAVPKEQPNG